MVNTAKLLTQPTLSGTVRQSPLYNYLNTGLTDTIMLIGHADATKMYQPYKVVDIRETINFLNADSTSPLMRAFLECYNAGCKDIWLYPAAPMNEYVDIITNRFTTGYLPALGSKNFYQKYYDRLTAAYSVLNDWDNFEVIVPIEAVFYDAGGVDFATQLVNFCNTNFTTTGTVSIGVLGTRIKDAALETAVQNMSTDTRLSGFGEPGKNVIVVVGEGLMHLPQLTTSYNASLATQVAANLATVPLTRSIAGTKLYGAISLIGPDLSSSQMDRLTQAKLNPAVRTKRGKRGFSYEVMLLTDNTLGVTGTDFWSMGQMHIVANIINKVRSIGYSAIGESDQNQFRQNIWEYLDLMQRNNYIRGFSLNIQFSNRNATATVDIGVNPIFGLRTIYFTCEVGPGV